MLAWSLECAFAAPVGGVSLVLAPGADDLAALAEAMHRAAALAPPLHLVTAQDAAEGMGASLRAGAASASPDSALVVFLADMPDVPRHLAAELLEALDAGADAAAPVCRSRRGHPVAFAASLRPALLTLRGDDGAREVLRSLGDRLALIDTDDDGVLFDVDRPQDLFRTPAPGKLADQRQHE